MKQIFVIALMVAVGALTWLLFTTPTPIVETQETPTLTQIELSYSDAIITIDNFEELEADNFIAKLTQTENETEQTIFENRIVENNTIIYTDYAVNGNYTITVTANKSGYISTTATLDFVYELPTYTASELEDLADGTEIRYVGVVTAKYYTNILYLEDESGSTCIYDNAFDFSTYQIGDEVEFFGIKATYTNPQIIGVTGGVVLSQNNAVSDPIVLDLSIDNLSDYACQLVTVTFKYNGVQSYYDIFYFDI